MKELFSVGANYVMLQTSGSKEAFTLNGRPDLQKEEGELAGIQHFGFSQQRPQEQQPQLTGSGNDK